MGVLSFLALGFAWFAAFAVGNLHLTMVASATAIVFAMHHAVEWLWKKQSGADKSKPSARSKGKTPPADSIDKQGRIVID